MKCRIFREGSPAFQYLAMFTGTLNIISSGMHYGWASPSLPQLLADDSHIPMTEDEGSWIAVMVLLGAICGAFATGYFLNTFGRKFVILFASIPFTISWLMIAFATNVPVLLAARFLAGIADGCAFCSIPPYIGEISEARIRGFLVTANSVSHSLGILLMNVIGSYLSIRDTALISTAPSILLILTFSWMPESPYYLLMKGKIEEARRCLQIFRGKDDVEEELSRLNKAVVEQKEHSGRFRDLFTDKTNRKALGIMFGLRAAQQLSGINAFLFYAQIIFKEASDVISPVASSTIYFGVSLVLSGFSSIIVDKTGRRPLLIISITGTIFALLIEGSFFYIEEKTSVDVSGFTVIPIVALIVFVVMYAFGLQAIPILLVGELFPTNLRAFAVSFQDIYYSLFATAASKFFQFAKDDFGIFVPFFVFAGCCVMGLIFIIIFVPETKGKTLEDIQVELRGVRR